MKVKSLTVYRPSLTADETQTNALAPAAADGGVFFVNGEDLDVRVDGSSVTYQAPNERHLFVGLPFHVVYDEPKAEGPHWTGGKSGGQRRM